MGAVISHLNLEKRCSAVNPRIRRITVEEDTSPAACPASGRAHTGERDRHRARDDAMSKNQFNAIMHALQVQHQMLDVQSAAIAQLGQRMAQMESHILKDVADVVHKEYARDHKKNVSSLESGRVMVGNSGGHHAHHPTDHRSGTDTRSMANSDHTSLAQSTLRRHGSGTGLHAGKDLSSSLYGTAPMGTVDQLELSQQPTFLTKVRSPHHHHDTQA